MTGEAVRHEMLDLFITRSQNLPFHLHIGFPDAQSTTHFSDKAQDTVQRSRSIRVHIRKGSLQAQLGALFDRPAPMAELVWIESEQSTLDSTLR